jgi:hypothetical protein
VSTEVDVRLKEQIQATKREILRLWNERENNDISLREHIRKLADQLVESGIKENLVSTEIIRMFGASGTQNRLQRYIADTLEGKYKRKYSRDEIVRSGTISVIEECSIELQKQIEVLDKIQKQDPEDVGRRGFQEIAQRIKDSKDRIEKIADLYNIPLPYISSHLPTNEEDPIGQEDAPLPEDQEIINLRYVLCKEIKALQDDLEKIEIGIRVKNYVSDNKQTLQEYILGVKSLRALIKPVTDRKWGQDMLGWCDIIENYYDQSGTFSATKSAVDVADLVNPKTGKAIQRKLTKEQIDAVHPQLLNNMRFIIKNIPFVISMFKNFREKELGYRAKRRVKLGPKLSESA